MLPQRLDPCPYFADLPDPDRETRNKLQDILMIVRCAVLSGVEGLGGDGSVCGRKRNVVTGLSGPA